MKLFAKKLIIKFIDVNYIVNSTHMIQIRNPFCKEGVLNIIDNTGYLLHDLPDPLSISTISVSGTLNSDLILVNIRDYIAISASGIVSVELGNIFRGEHIKRAKKRIIYDNHSRFGNQMTIVVNVYDKKYINVKLFHNGAFQMTGCKSIYDVNIVLTKVFNALETNISTYDEVNKKMRDIPFIIEKKLSVIHFQIDMILANLEVKYFIDRDSLYHLLQNNKISCRYDPDNHAGVNIKLVLSHEMNKKNKKVKPITIFVFQSGKITITSARNREELVTAFDFITNMLESNKDYIIKKNLMSFISKEELDDIIIEHDKMMTEKIEVVKVEEDNIVI